MGKGFWTGKGLDTINWGGTIEAEVFKGDGSQLTGIPSPDLSGYVPYTGATGAVNLGVNTLTTTGTLGAGATGSVGATLLGRTLLGGATDDTTSALQVQGAISNYNAGIGLGTIINADGSIGVGASSAGVASTAIGVYAYSGGGFSTALGSYAYSGGYSSTALGISASSEGDYSTAIGSYASSEGYSSAAIGNNAYSAGDASTAIGSYAYSGGVSSTALGNSAFSVGGHSTALGGSASASADYSTTIGSFNSGLDNLVANSMVLGGYSGSTDEAWITLNHNKATFASSQRVLIGGATDDTTSTLQVLGQVAITAAETDKTGAVSGHAYFSQPFTGATYKKVVIRLAALNGATTSYTFPVAFSFTPSVMTTNGLATTLVTTLSTTGCVVTGATSTGFIFIEGY